MFFRYGLPLLAAAALLFAARHVVVADQEPPKESPPVEPSRTPFKSSLAGAGVIEPKSENISIGSHLPGVVTEVFVDVNTEVEAGQKLFRLDDRQLRAELEVRQAMLSSALASQEKIRNQPRPEELPITEARVEEARVAVEDARAQFARTEQGYRTGAVAEDEFVKRKYAVATANAHLATGVGIEVAQGRGVEAGLAGGGKPGETGPRPVAANRDGTQAIGSHRPGAGPGAAKERPPRGICRHPPGSGADGHR